MNLALRLCFVAASAHSLLAQSPALDRAAEDFFEKQVRPILARNCQTCHGPALQRGSLRLDSRAALLQGGDLGPAIVPGDPENSLLIKAVRQTSEHLQMPPSGKLKDQQIADLASWIQRGAVWPGSPQSATPTSARATTNATPHQSHWAFQPLRKPTIPPVSAPNPIDRFLLQRMEAAGLKPAPQADPATLLRRLRFNLTGLPPTAEELVAFQKDSSPQAFAHLIDRLLASQQYGEHWGRHWLDVARYADSNGSEVDHALAHAWRYRNYVIGAFQHDKPFPQFIQEQLAGDLVPNPTPETLAATGFLMLGAKSLAELDKPKLVADIVDEQVDTVSRAFMGLTMGCARCHDHKFDPLPTADYYSMAGIFFSTRMMDVSKRVATWTERPVHAQAAAELETLQKQLESIKTERAALVKSTRGQRQRLSAAADFVVVEAEHYIQGNVVVDNDDFGKGIGVVRTRRTYPDELQYEVEVLAAGDYQLEFRYASNESRPVEILINGELKESTAAGEVTGGFTADTQKCFLQGRYALRAGNNSLVIRRDGPVPLLDKLVIGKPSAHLYCESVPAKPSGQPGDEQTKRALAVLDKQIAELEKRIDAVPMAMAPFDGPVADSPILIRGSLATPGKVAPRGFPSVAGSFDCPRPSTATSGRLELAAWLADPRHLLTARVIVNRVWLWQFGQGLVTSPDNFGLRGEKPSHPELLDWLAAWFMENGWSIHKLNRLICTSEAYQRASSPGVRPQDPANRLLSSFPRRRLAAEEIRDAMLAVSGQLDLTPADNLMEVRNRTYANGGNAPKDIVSKMHYESTRRSVYLPVVRTALYDLFAIFDHPAPGMLTGQRSTTTVAPQALFLLNSPLVKAQARHFAKRLAATPGDSASRVRQAYQLAYGREASPAEVSLALDFLASEERTLHDAGNPDPGLGAWSRFAQTLLMSNDFLYLR